METIFSTQNIKHLIVIIVIFLSADYLSKIDWTTNKYKRMINNVFEISFGMLIIFTIICVVCGYAYLILENLEILGVVLLAILIEKTINK